MLIGSGGHEKEVAENSLEIEINQDDKFFTRIMSKETSMANSSCRVYYGGASGSIPFRWESRPGTPKHVFSDHTSMLPPLTPPPSYHHPTSNSNSMHKKNYIKPTLLSTIFLTLSPKKTSTHHVSPSSSVSSATTSSSSFYSSPSGFQKRRLFSCSISPIRCQFDDYVDDDEEDGDHRMPKLCYGSSSVKRKAFHNNNNSKFQWCYSMGKMKNAFLSIVRHGSPGAANYN